MEKKINIAELLKDCKKGMELDCTMYDNLVFCEIDSEAQDYPIITQLPNGVQKWFTSDGRYELNPNAKCVIFPKGKTTWEGFIPPCQFKDGDVIYTDNFIAILSHIAENGRVWYHCYYCIHTKTFKAKHDYGIGNINHEEFRLATEEEKQKLFDAIKANGYKWNAETKTLKELPKFKIEKGKWYVCIKDLLDNYANKAFCKGDTYLSTQDGSLIPSNSNVPFEVVCASTYFRDWTINDAKDGDVLARNWHKGDDYWEKIVIFKKYHNKDKCVEGYGNTFKNRKLVFHEEVPYFSKTWTSTLQPATKEQRDFLFKKIKEAGYEWNAETKTLEKLPKFNVGNKIKKKGIDDVYAVEIASIVKSIYTFKGGSWQSVESVDRDYELVPSKFDITNLKPFDKVLVRNDNSCWKIEFFERINKKNKNYPFVCLYGHNYKQCIPYKGNEHLLYTAKDCDEYFKTWE